MPFATIRQDQEIIILSEVSRKETNTIKYYLYVDLKNNTYYFHRGEGVGGG